MLAVLIASVIHPVPAADVPRCGRLIIEGNTFTPDRLILDRVPFYPGRVIPPAIEFEKVERQLLVAFASRFDLDAGRWPTARLLPGHPDSAFRDVVVRFPERSVKTGPVPFWLYLLVYSGLVPEPGGDRDWPPAERDAYRRSRRVDRSPPPLPPPELPAVR